MVNTDVWSHGFTVSNPFWLKASFGLDKGIQNVIDSP